MIAIKPKQIILHKPHTKHGQEELEHLLANVHAQAVTELINDFPISPDKKKNMVERIIKNLR